MTETLLRISLVAVAGAVGAVCRSLVANVASSLLDRPWVGTLTVNVVGCFCFGLVVGWLDQRTLHNEHLRLLLLTGFMGAFTTFSTFAFDTYQLSHEGLLPAAGNVLLNVVLGLSAVVLGLWLMQPSPA